MDFLRSKNRKECERDRKTREGVGRQVPVTMPYKTEHFELKKINKTNCNSSSENTTLSDLIAERDTLTLKAGILRNFIEIAGRKVELYSNKEIKILSTVNVSVLQKNLDELSKKIRETDTELQKANWNIDLIEN